MLSTVAVIAAFGGSIAFCTRRLLRYLRFFQQEEYSAGRFLSWIAARRAFDRKGTAIALGAALLTGFLFSPAVDVGISAAAAAALCLAAFNEEDPRRAGKITLKMTERAKRLYRWALGLYAVLALILALAVVAVVAPERAAAASWLLQALLIQSTPLWLAASAAVLQPGEKRIQAKFRKEAEDILARCAPYIIGITGSYGKTSTKNVLGRLLDVCLAPTFFPKGGINTVMGITREIREQLKPGHKFAVIEMGAYNIGSIKRLCDFTPPRAAVVTAVGLMHLERFGSAENVYRAKSELAQALPADGVLVCNGDDAGARRMAAEHRKATTLLYGLDRDAGALDAWTSDVNFSVEGTSFVVHWKGGEYPGFVKLHGRLALSNLLGAFTMACALGADPQFVIAAMRNIEPVSNRLEVRSYEGYVQINDAYNSNPVGFAAALEVLRAIPGKRKVLVTPGMIELGEEQARENETAAALAAKSCDLVYLVGAVNREAFLRGLQRGGFPMEKTRIFAHRDEALAALRADQQAEDVVLLENDLPDLFEMDLSF